MSKASEAQAAIEAAIREHYEAVCHHLERLQEWMTLLAVTSPADLERLERAVNAVRAVSVRSARTRTPEATRHSDVIPASVIPWAEVKAL